MENLRSAYTCRNCRRCYIRTIPYEGYEVLWCCPTEEAAREGHPENQRDRRWSRETLSRRIQDWEQSRTRVDEGMVCDEILPAEPDMEG